MSAFSFCFAFIDATIDALAESARGVVCVRLVVLALVMQDRPWSVEELNKLGGVWFAGGWRTQGAPRTAATLGYGMQRRWRKNQNAVGALKTMLSKDGRGHAH